MREYSFSEARQQFASVLEEAGKEGVVCIKKRDGAAFLIRPVAPRQSPLDVVGVDLGLNAADIVAAIREGRDQQVE